jgi:hypothetical protein
VSEGLPESSEGPSVFLQETFKSVVEIKKTERKNRFVLIFIGLKNK